MLPTPKMSSQAALTAFVEFGTDTGGRGRERGDGAALPPPVASVARVGIVRFVISVLGELLFNSGRAGVPAMLRKRPHAQLQAANPENSTFQPSANPRTGVFADISPVFASAA
jgi:hypothetical protein